MNKTISLGFQRILKFIPVLNGLILFIWLFNYNHTKKEPKVFNKSLIIMFSACIPMVCMQIVISKLFVHFPAILTISDLIAIYVIPLVLGHALIKYQENIGLN